MVDTMIHDGLWSTFTGQVMGESTDAVNAELGIDREEQDAWSARSHQRAAGWESGALAEEVVRGRGPAAKGSTRSRSSATRASGRHDAPSRSPR